MTVPTQRGQNLNLNWSSAVRRGNERPLLDTLPKGLPQPHPTAIVTCGSPVIANSSRAISSKRHLSLSGVVEQSSWQGSTHRNEQNAASHSLRSADQQPASYTTTETLSPLAAALPHLLSARASSCLPHATAHHQPAPPLHSLPTPLGPANNNSSAATSNSNSKPRCVRGRKRRTALLCTPTPETSRTFRLSGHDNWTVAGAKYVRYRKYLTRPKASQRSALRLLRHPAPPIWPLCP